MKTPKQQVIERLNRIEGQIRGIRKMVECDKPCPDVLKQILAVQGAVRSLTQFILKEHLTTCVQNLNSQDPNLKELSEQISHLITKLTDLK